MHLQPKLYQIQSVDRPTCRSRESNTGLLPGRRGKNGNLGLYTTRPTAIKQNLISTAGGKEIIILLITRGGRSLLPMAKANDPNSSTSSKRQRGMKLLRYLEYLRRGLTQNMCPK